MNIDHETDKGPLNIPKIFRRQVYYEELKEAEVSKEGSLKEYLDKGKDKCYLRKYYFKYGTKTAKRKLSEFISLDGKIKFIPGELIFVEDSTFKLRDKYGKVIEDWNHKG